MRQQESAVRSLLDAHKIGLLRRGYSKLLQNLIFRHEEATLMFLEVLSLPNVNYLSFYSFAFHLYTPEKTISCE